MVLEINGSRFMVIGKKLFIKRWCGTGLFLFGMMVLVLQHARFLAAGTTAFLAADFRDFLPVDALHALPAGFQPVAQFAPRQVAIELAGAGASAFDIDPRRRMAQVHAR